MKIEVTTLNNGLRAVYVHKPGNMMLSTGVLVGAGGRFESPETFGISHFLEHAVFKGTKKFPNSKDFRNHMESIGAIQNAETDDDYTMYHNLIPTENYKEGLEILKELVANPSLPKNELEKERGAIIEEINMVNDDPSHFLGIQINKALYKGQNAASDVLGPKENILKLKASELKSYMKEYYKAKNMALVVIGNITDDIKEEAVRQFGTIDPGEKMTPAKIQEDQQRPQAKTYYKETAQTNLALLYRTFSFNDKEHMALKLLNFILGQGTGASLFQEVREERGLAYHISSHTRSDFDTGYFAVYGGLDTKRIEEAIGVIKSVLTKAQKKITQKEIKRATELYKSVYYYQVDNPAKMNRFYGHRLLWDSGPLDAAKEIEAIENVGAEDLQKVAQRIFQPKNENLLVVGPFKNKEKFAKILSQ